MLPGKKLTPSIILQIVRRRVWLIVAPPVLGMFVALLYSSTVPNLYQSDMLIAVDPQRVPDSFVKSTVTLETERRMEALQVQVLSRTELGELIEAFDLYAEERRIQPIEDVVSKMRNNISVDLQMPRPRWGQIPEPTAFHVRFIYTDPEMAARVTQHLGALFVEHNVRDRAALAGGTNRFLESQLADARQRLEQQERRVEAFRQRYGKELPTQMQSNMQVLSSSQLQVQGLVESIARDRDRKLMLERLYREAANEPAPAAVTTPQNGSNNSIPASAREQLVTARAQLASLLLRYKPNHPDVTRAQRLIADLEPRAAAEERAAAEQQREGTEAMQPIIGDPARRDRLGQMRAEIESLNRQVAFKESEERRIRDSIAEYQRRIEAVPGLESEWTKLIRDYDTLQQAYKDLLGKSTAAQVAADLEEEKIGQTFRIVDPAVVPVHPLPSIRARINAVGFAVALMIGLGIAALLEYRDASFRSEADVLEVLALPVLACVPRIVSASERRQQRRQTAALSLTGVMLVAIATYVTWTLKLWNSLV